MKTYYYHDSVHDDFAATDIKKITLPDDFRFVDRRVPYLIGETVVRCIAFPFLVLILKVGYLQRVKNRKVLRKAKGKGFFVFANHTDYMLDAYNPSVILCPTHAHIIVNPDAVSIKGLGTVVKMLGAVPIPTTLKGMKRYKDAINELLRRKRGIMIYPEAHIWPFYTDIRPFGTESFHYAVEADVPSFTFTNVYQQRKLKFIKLPKVVTYVDGPFYPDPSLSKAGRVKDLRDQIYAAMKQRVDENPKYNYNNYVYVENAADSNKKVQ